MLRECLLHRILLSMQRFAAIDSRLPTSILDEENNDGKKVKLHQMRLTVYCLDGLLWKNYAGNPY